MKKILLLIFFISASTISLAQKTMVPLKEYMNKKNDVFAEGHIFIRCAALNFYIGSIYKNNKEMFETTNKNFEYFKSKSSTHFQIKGKMSKTDAEIHFLKEWEKFSYNYFNDGNENNNNTKKFIIGYIAEDLEICNNIK